MRDQLDFCGMKQNFKKNTYTLDSIIGFIKI